MSNFMPYANDVVWSFFAFGLVLLLVGVAWLLDLSMYPELAVIGAGTGFVLLAYVLGNTPADTPDGK